MNNSVCPHAIRVPEEMHKDMKLVMRVIPMPNDANPNGDIFGGWIMSQVDLAGYMVSVSESGGRVTTVAVDEFIFRNAVSVGDFLSFYARIERIGHTSLTLRVEAWAERCPSDPHLVKVTEAKVTYVAIDDKGRPRPVHGHGNRGQFNAKKSGNNVATDENMAELAA